MNFDSRSNAPETPSHRGMQFNSTRKSNQNPGINFQNFKGKKYVIRNESPRTKEACLELGIEVDRFLNKY